MGQQFIKAKISTEVKPIVGLSKDAVYAICAIFNTHADSLGLAAESFTELIQPALREAEIPSESWPAQAGTIFQILDTDQNGLVDAFEILSTVVALSGMTFQEKLETAFKIFDFHDGGALTVDELVIMFQSTLVGLAKISNLVVPTQSELELMANKAFESADVSVDGRVSKMEYFRYCEKTPQVSCWLSSFEDADEDEAGSDQEDTNINDEDLQLELNLGEEQGVDALEMVFHDEGAEEDGDGENKPYANTFQALVPEEPVEEVLTAPDTDLSLEWVHGYRGADVRNNIRYGRPEQPTDADEGEMEEGSVLGGDSKTCPVVYHAAALGVVLYYDREEGAYKQRYFRHHTDEITCLALTTDRKLAATGQIGKHPKLYVWEVATCKVRAVFSGFHRRAVQYVCFHPTKPLVASVGKDNNNSLAIYDFREKCLLFTARNGPQRVLSMCWSSGGSTIAVAGVKFINFWSGKQRKPGLGLAAISPATAAPNATALAVSPGAGAGAGATAEGSVQDMIWSRRRGIFSNKGEKAAAMTCVVPIGRRAGVGGGVIVGGEVFLSGNHLGHLYVWKGRNIVQSIKGGSTAHSGGITCIYASESKPVVVTGGRDESVRVWRVVPRGSSLETLTDGGAGFGSGLVGYGSLQSRVDNLTLTLEASHTIDMRGTPSVLYEPRSLCLSEDGQTIVVGTKSCEIYELRAVDRPKGAEGEEDEGEDEEGGGGGVGGGGNKAGKVLNGGKPLVRGHYGDTELWGLCPHPSERMFGTVGDEGAVMVWDIDGKSCVAHTNLEVSGRALAFSPDGAKLAVGCEDGHIYVLDSQTMGGDGEGGPPLPIIVHMEEPKEAVSDLKFSPDGGLLAVGSRDGLIYLYKTEVVDRAPTSASNQADNEEGDGGGDGEGEGEGGDGSPAAGSAGGGGGGAGGGSRSASAMSVASKHSAKSAASGKRIPTWPLLGTCSGHSSFITHIDFSADGTVLRSNCGAYELLFWGMTPEGFGGRGEDGEDGDGEGGGGDVGGSKLCQQILDIGSAEFKEIEWSSSTCTIEYQVKGTIPLHPLTEGTDINAVDKSKDNPICATADDLGGIKLYNYPCLSRGRGTYCEFRGHSAHVTNVRFMPTSETHLVSAGGRDRCLFQWSVEADEAQDSAPEDDPEGEGAEEDEDEDEEEMGKGGAKAEDSDDDEDLIDGKAYERGALVEAFRGDDADLLFMVEERADASDGQFAVNQPWMGTEEEPADENIQSPTVPDDNLDLEWIHGFSGQRTRGSAHYNVSGEIVYPAAAAGVVLTKSSSAGGERLQNRQSYMLSHSDDVACLAMHPNRKIVASGQLGRRPLIIVWDSTKTGEGGVNKGPLAVIECPEVRGISALAFSPDGSSLACGCLDDAHTLMVYNWADGTLQSASPTGPNKILGLSFSYDGGKVLQYGVKHFKVWSLMGRTLTAKKGLFTSMGKVQTIVCGAYLVPTGQEEPAENAASTECVLGAVDGTIYKVEGRRVVQAADGAHTKAVLSLCAFEDMDGEGATLVSGGADGLVKIWSADLEELRTFNLAKIYPGIYCPQVRSLSVSVDNRKVLLGTRGSDILELTLAEGIDVNDGPLVSGHYKDELWGLSCHPHQPEFATVGDDKILRIWNLHSKRCARTLDLGDFARACDYSPDGHLIAVGMGGNVGRGRRRKDGAVLVVSAYADGLRVIHESQDAREWISDIKFSPNGKVVAAASHDNNIYLYNALAGFTLNAVCNGHSAFVTHIDFSVDNQWIQSNSGDYEHLYFDASTGQQNPRGASELKDMKWHTWTCPFGWPMMGIFPTGCRGADVNSVSRSADGLLATADDFGSVKVFRYPAFRPGESPFNGYRGHSSHVTKCAWTPDASYLLTTGGDDRCVFQWRRQVDTMTESSAQEMASVSGGDSTSDGAIVQGDTWFGLKVGYTARDDMVAANGFGLAGTSNCCGGIFIRELARTVAFSLEEEVEEALSAGDGNNVTETTISPASALAVSKDGRYVATGCLVNSVPHVLIWDALSGAMVKVLPKCHRDIIACLAFSPDGRMLVSVGSDMYHTVALWYTSDGSWVDGRRLASSSDVHQPTYFATFLENPSVTEHSMQTLPWSAGLGNDDGTVMTAPSPYTFVTGGKNYIRFWNLQSRNITSYAGVFSPVGRPQSLICGVALPSPSAGVATGTASGDIYLWSSRRRVVTTAVSAHFQPCTGLTMAGLYLASCSSDGTIGVWSVEESSDKAELAMPDLSSSATVKYDVGGTMQKSGGKRGAGDLSSIVADSKGAKLLVGSRDGTVIEVVVDTGAMDPVGIAVEE